MDQFIQKCAEIAGSNAHRDHYDIAIVYDNSVSVSRALRASEVLRAELPEDHSIKVSVWKTTILDFEEIRGDAVLAAAAADIVIVALSGRETPAPTFYQWVNAWLESDSAKERALFTLFGDYMTPASSSLQTYLQHKTIPAGIDFFAYPEIITAQPDFYRTQQPLLPLSCLNIAEPGSEYDEWRPGWGSLANKDCEVTPFDVITHFSDYLRLHLEELRNANMIDEAEYTWSPDEKAFRD